MPHREKKMFIRIRPNASQRSGRMTIARRPPHLHVPIPAALDLAERLKRAFHLRSLPRKIPFDTGTGLRLPDRLPPSTVYALLVAAIAKTLPEHGAPWYIGDVVNWIKSHPASGVTMEGVCESLRSVKCYSEPDETLRKAASIAARFPLKTRVPGASVNHHISVRALPDEVALPLLREAAAKGLPYQWLDEQRDKYMAEHGLITPAQVAAQELRRQARAVYLLTSRRRGVRTDRLLGEVHALRKRIDDWERCNKRRTLPE